MGTTPSSALSTLRPDLAGALEQFDLEASRQGFVGLRFAPVIEVGSSAESYGRIPLDQLVQTSETSRTSAGGYNRVSGTADTVSYKTKEHGLEEKVDDRDARLYRQYWDAELLAAKRCRDAVIRNHERRVAALAATISNTTAAGTAWTSTSATPIINVRTAKLAVYDRTGVRPNAIVIPYGRFEYLKDNPEIIDRLKYAGFRNPDRSNITAEAIAQIFDIEQVLVADGMYRSTKEGQTATLAGIWTVSEAIVCRVARTADHKEPAVARTFHWSEDGSSIGGTMETYRDETVRADIVRCRMETDEVLVYQELGQRITGI